MITTAGKRGYHLAPRIVVPNEFIQAETVSRFGLIQALTGGKGSSLPLAHVLYELALLTTG